MYLLLLYALVKPMKFSLSGFLTVFSAISMLMIVICVCLILFKKIGIIDMDNKSIRIVNEVLADKSGISLKEIEDIEGFDEIVPEDLDYSYDYIEGC
jgi:hypothetical protein